MKSPHSISPKGREKATNKFNKKDIVYED